MADEIRQELGFDAGNTLQVAAALESGFNKLAASLDRFAGSTSRANTAADKVSKAIDHSAKKTNSWVISWETLTRVMMTQGIIRSINAIRDAFEFAYESQMKFSKAISEAKAIDVDRSFKQIATSVRQMSDAFNQPLEKVVEAQYELLSDQFTTLADRQNILTAANQLAKVTEDDLVGSSTLLTGALNAYGESSEMAGIRAAQFFRTIELGRLRAGELGTALGRLQAIGNELGVSLEELQAIMAAVTIGGVKASEAATQARSLMTAFLKPSEAMKKALTDLHVESGEAAIRTWGLVGALEKVKGTTDGTSQSMGQLFPNIRGISSALRLAGSGAKAYAESLAAINEADQTMLSAKSLEAMSTDAARLSAELNKLRNFFTAELGVEAVTTLNKLIGLVGGGNGLVGVLRLVTSETPRAVAAIGLLYLATMKFGTGADAAWKTFGTGVDGGVAKLGKLRTALGLLALYESAKMLGNVIGEKITEYIDAPQKAMQKATADNIKLIDQQRLATIRVKERESDELFKLLRQRVADASGTYYQDVANFQSAMKVQESIMKRAFDHIMQMRERIVQDLDAASKAALSKSKDEAKEALAIRQQVQDRNFDVSVSRFDDRWKARSYADQANSLANAAARLQAAARGPDQLEKAANAWARAEQYAQKAAQHMGSERQAAELLNSLAERKAKSLEKNAQLQRQISEGLEKQRGIEEANNTALVRARKEIENKVDAWTKSDTGELVLKNKDKYKQDLAAAEKLKQSYVDLLTKTTSGEGLKRALADAKGIDEALRDAKQMLGSVYLKDIQLAPENIAKLWDDLQKSADKVRVKVPFLAHLEKITGLDIVAHGVETVIKDAAEKFKVHLASAAQEAASQKVLIETKKEYSVGQAAFRKTQQSDEYRFTSQLRPEAYAGLEKAKALLDKLHGSQAIAEADIIELQTAIDSIDWSAINKSPILSKKLSSSLDTMLDAVLRQKQALDTLEKSQAPGDKQEMDAANQQLQLLRQKKTTQGETATQAEREQAAIDAGRAAIELQAQAATDCLAPVAALVVQWQNVATAAQAAAMAAAAASGGEAGSEQLAAARGGPIGYFQRGFVPRGTDTIPAMLSPGEFVMNASASRRWYSQLVAMNAGMKPAYRESGGSVTNAGIVGDVTVNVTDGTSPQTGREIVRALNREIRRGTSKLRV